MIHQRGQISQIKNDVSDNWRQRPQRRLLGRQRVGQALLDRLCASQCLIDIFLHRGELIGSDDLLCQQLLWQSDVRLDLSCDNMRAGIEFLNGLFTRWTARELRSCQAANQNERDNAGRRITTRARWR